MRLMAHCSIGNMSNNPMMISGIAYSFSAWASRKNKSLSVK